MYPLTRSTNRNRSWGNNSADFTAGFVNGVFDQRITHTRASTATYIDSTGAVATAAVNVPRITYDPATLECRGYLHEAQTTNLVTYSDDLTNGAWSLINGTTTRALTTLKGLPACRIITAVGQNGGVFQSPAVGASTTTTWSAIVDLASFYGIAGAIRFQCNHDAISSYADLNSLDGSLGINGDCTPLIETMGGSVFRVSITFTAVAAASNPVYVFRVQADGDGSKYFTVAAPQLEANLAATSYIPTAGSAVPRAADIAYIDVATHLAGLSPTNFTVYCEAQFLFHQASRSIVGSDALAGAAPIAMHTNSSQVGTWDGSSSLNVTAVEFVTQPRKMASSHRSGARTIALAGTRNDGATNAMGAFTELWIGGSDGGGNGISGLYRVLRVWKRGFSAAETEALTE
jgi:hypothetical protein